MRTKLSTIILLLLLIDCGYVSSEEINNRHLLETFALDMFEPGMRWAYTSSKIRPKILARWGPPDEMDISINPDRDVPPVYWAMESWVYEDGPTIIILSSEYGEYVKKITLGINTQINLALGLYPGASRYDFYKNLGIKDNKYAKGSPIKYLIEEQTRQGHVSVEVTIVFDDRDYSEQVIWEVVPGH